MRHSFAQRHTAFGMGRHRFQWHECAEDQPLAQIIALQFQEAPHHARDRRAVRSRGDVAGAIPLVLARLYEIFENDGLCAKGLQRPLYRVHWQFAPSMQPDRPGRVSLELRIPFW